MNIYIILLMLSLSPILVYFIHVVLIRLMKRKSPQLSAILSTLIGNIPFICICLIYILKNQINVADKISLVFYNFIVYNGLAYTYFHIFNMSETARRIYILIELKNAGMLKKENILKRYSIEDIIENRLSRLLDLRQLRLEGNKYKVNGQLLLTVAKMYKLWVYLLGYNKRIQLLF